MKQKRARSPLAHSARQSTLFVLVLVKSTPEFPAEPEHLWHFRRDARFVRVRFVKPQLRLSSSGFLIAVSAADAKDHAARDSHEMSRS
jgi:hypothetical protein